MTGVNCGRRRSDERWSCPRGVSRRALPRTAYLLVATLLAAVVAAPRRACAETPKVMVLSLDGAIQPASLRMLERGIERAGEAGSALLVVELNTPGGLLVSLREMTTAIVRSEVPIAVYVTPPGGRAASAGFFLLMAADVAAMAPGTNTGAARPVRMGQEGDRSKQALAKSVEDAAALIRALAAARGRSVEWAERAVRASRSYSAEEALQRGLIDVVAANREALLEHIDGSTVERWDGRTLRPRLSGAAVTEIERTLAERLLMVIAAPQVAYLLLMLGLLGLMVELFSPGLVVPGVAGGISLLLALYAFSILPVNWAGVLLIALGIGLFGAEAFVASYGLLALAGAASFVFGSLILVDSPLPSIRLGLELIIPSVLVLALTSLLLLTWALRLRKAKPTTGLEGMIGELGEVVAAIEPGHAEGRVFVHGEYWAATAARPIAGGARVRVEQVEGHRLRVVPVWPEPT